MMNHRSAVAFWRRVVCGSAVLALTALVYGAILHVVLFWSHDFLNKYEGVEPAVFYFLSQATAEGVRATLPRIGGAWNRFAAGRASSRKHASGNDPATAGREEFLTLIAEIPIE